MDLKDAIYNIVLSNLQKAYVREIYDKAITLVSGLEYSPLTVYIRMYSYSTFTRFVVTNISQSVFNEITGENFFYIPVTAYGNQYSLEYRVLTANGDHQYIEATTDLPNLDIYNKLMSYEKEMLDGHSRRESDRAIAS